MAHHRTIYLDALDPEGDFSAAPVIDEIRHEVWRHSDSGPADLDSLVAMTADWSAGNAQIYRETCPSPVAATMVQSMLVNCAPLSLMAGAWLQWMSCAANADSELSLRIMALYAADLGAGYPSADRGSVFLALMRRHRAAEGAYSAAQLPANEHIADISFRLAGQLMLMSRRPDLFSPELLGADLCLRATGTLPPLAVLDRQEVDQDTLRDLDMGGTRASNGAAALADSLTVSRTFLALCAAGQTLGEANTADGARRWNAGYHWAFHELKDWSRQLVEELTLARNPAYDMWQLIYSRSSQAAMYHDAYKLDGQPLSEWFRTVERGPEQFLRSLAESRLVRPGDPDRSRLVRGLIDYRGPMFRVFTEADIEVIRRWIASLRGEQASSEDTGTYYRQLHAAQGRWHRRTAPASSARKNSHPSPAPAASRPASVAPDSVREAYHLLLGRHNPPHLRGFACKYVRDWLARSRYLMGRHSAETLPERWENAQGLRQWLEEQHRRHGHEFQEGADAPLPARENLIDSTIQTAPLTLIDGGWIQGFTDYQHASSMTGHFLFETYWDELGNGQLVLNHPLIYRSLLSQMGVEPPPTRSRSFVEWPGFKDESFRLPVYWLCISRFPRTFMPEILGLNLAMELSGVGGGYRRMSRALKHYGFSTRFVDIHNTIDNVSTGHSAWAIEALASYVDEVSAVMGTEITPVIWDRVRTGYRSLTPPGGFLASCFARTIGRRTIAGMHASRGKQREVAVNA